MRRTFQASRTARNEAIGAVYPVHTPYLLIDEAALPVGVRAHCLMALDYLHRQAPKPPDRRAPDSPN